MCFSLVSNNFLLCSQTSSLFDPPRPLAFPADLGLAATCPTAFQLSHQFLLKKLLCEAGNLNFCYECDCCLLSPILLGCALEVPLRGILMGFWGGTEPGEGARVCHVFLDPKVTTGRPVLAAAVREAAAGGRVISFLWFPEFRLHDILVTSAF